MDPISRRHFMTRSSAVAVGFAGLQTSLSKAATFSLIQSFGRDELGFGALVADPNKIIDLPAGFSYQIISRIGASMDDGLLVPGKHDGMGAFPFIKDDGSIDPDRTVLIRNHEIEDAHKTTGAFETPELLAKINPESFYDFGHGKPSRGGTTTLVFNTKTQTLESHWLSLAGTERNCAGGITPRNTWLTCEETASVKGDRFERDHGYVFEVPFTTSPRLADPKPIYAMGRFYREACCTDPKTGIVYMSEDRHDGILYRYIPNDRDDLHQGGKVQALRVDHTPSMDTRNWEEQTIKVNERLRVRWIDLDDVQSPKDDLRYRGFNAGAARFARCEGMWWGNDSVYFAATTGGKSYSGQLWRLTPNANANENENGNGNGNGNNASPGAHDGDELELFIEPNDSSVIERADNITFSPWGDLIACEDENKPPRLIGVTMQGQTYVIARNAMGNSEFAGATFSMDGSTLFVNIQNPGFTLAITGPWKDR